MLKKISLSLGIIGATVVIAACAPTPDPPPPTQDVEAVVRTVVAEAFPTPTPDLNATVQAAVQATVTTHFSPAPTSKLRPPSEWTELEPATKDEIEAEIEKRRGQILVFASWGGSYQEAQRQAYAIPFQERFGIAILDEHYPTLEKARYQSQSGNVNWHLFDAPPYFLNDLWLSGDLERLDFSVIDSRRYFDVVKRPYLGGGGITWSEVWAYNTDVYPADAHPLTMADIYNPEKFPGNRAWGYHPGSEMIFVLLSENPGLLKTEEGRASLSALTPQQVDRAFELFNEYRDQVDAFWQSGAECPQFLMSGEMSMCTAWNNTIFDAVQEGAPVRICWECGHVLNTGGWGIINGLKRQDPQAFELAQLYMAWTSLPENNARISQFIPYGPINSASTPYFNGPEYNAFRNYLPSSPSNLPYAIFEDEVHVGLNEDLWRDRWNAFQGTFN